MCTPTHVHTHTHTHTHTNLCSETYPKENEYFEKAIKYGGRFWARMPLGESRYDVCARVDRLVDRIVEEYYKHGIAQVVVVSHGVTLRAFAMQWLNRTAEWMERERNPENASVRLFEGDRDLGYIFEGFPRSRAPPCASSSTATSATSATATATASASSATSSGMLVAMSVLVFVCVCVCVCVGVDVCRCGCVYVWMCGCVDVWMCMCLLVRDGRPLWVVLASNSLDRALLVYWFLPYFTP
jgi:Histidine phosphatase superfamily (branch 1)